MKTIPALALSILVGSTAFAQEPLEDRGYFGFDLGRLDYSGSGISDGASSIGGTGGFQVSRFFALEGGYMHSQRFSGVVPGEPPVTTVSLKADSYFARAVTTFPIVQRVEAVAAAGYHRTKFKGGLFRGQQNERLSTTESGASWLIGVQLRHEYGFIGRLSYEERDVDIGDFSGVTVTLGYLF